MGLFTDIGVVVVAVVVVVVVVAVVAVVVVVVVDSAVASSVHWMPEFLNSLFFFQRALTWKGKDLASMLTTLVPVFLQYVWLCPS